MSIQLETADHAPSPSTPSLSLSHTECSSRSQGSQLQTVHLAGIVEAYVSESGTPYRSCIALLERVAVLDRAGKEISSLLELRGPFAKRSQALALLGIREEQLPTPSGGSIEGRKVHAYKRGSLPAAQKRKENAKTGAVSSLLD